MTAIDLDIAPITSRDDRLEYLELRNRLRPYFASTIDELENELDWDPPGALRVLARIGGTPVALAKSIGNQFRPGSSISSAQVLVDETWRRRGIGTRLYDAISAHARDDGYTGLRVHVIENETDGIDFWGKRGFREVERFVDVALDLERFEVPPVELPDGMRVTTVAERPELLRGWYDIITEALEDIPAEDETEMPPWEKWQELVSRPPLFRPDAMFVVVAPGPDGNELPVGIGEIEFQLAQPDVAWHGFTAVRRDYRRRGIARALKFTTIGYAKQCGIRQLRTENEARNSPIRTLNIALGYKPLPARMMFDGPLAGGPPLEQEGTDVERGDQHEQRPIAR